MKSKIFRKIASLALVAALTATSVVPAYATDMEKTEQSENNETTDETEETEPSGQTESEETYPYIIMLPTEEGVSYKTDKSHISEDLSSEDYQILLYEAQENVEFTVVADKEFSIINAADNSTFLGYEDVKNGKVSFQMPEADLAVLFQKTETETENDQTEEEIQSECQVEETEQIPAVEESETEENLLTEETDQTEVTEETESMDQTEALQTESEVQATESSDVKSLPMEELTPAQTEDTVTESEAETETESNVPETEDAEDEDLAAILPEKGSSIELGEEYVWLYDMAFDITGYIPDYALADYVNIAYSEGKIDFSDQSVSLITYKATLKDDNSYSWDLVLPVIVDSAKGMATIHSDNIDQLMHNEQGEGYTGVIPEKIGDTVDAGVFHVTVGEDFNVWDLNLGYDLTKYNVGVHDDGGFDATKIGTYEVFYEVNSYLNPDYQFLVKCQIVVEKPDYKAGAMTIHVKNGILQAEVAFSDGTKETVVYGSDYSSKKTIDSIVVSPVRETKIQPKVSVIKNNTDYPSAIISEDLKDNIYTADMNQDLVIGEDTYVVVIDYPDYDPTEGGARKATGGLERNEEDLAFELEDATNVGKTSTFAVEKAATVVKTKNFSNIGSCTELSGAVTNFNPPGTAYNQAKISFNNTFKNNLKKFVEENDAVLKGNIPTYKWTSCASGHGAAGWFNTSYCTSVTATAKLIDTDGDKAPNRLTVVIHASGPDADYQSMSASFTLGVDDAGTLRIRKFSESADFVSVFSGVRVNTTFAIYDNKACRASDLVETVKVAAKKGEDRVGTNVDLSPGTYWIKEYGKCPGHTSNNTVYGPYKINAGETVMSDRIYNVPYHFNGILITKKDSNNKPLANAIFKITADFTSLGKRTWFFKSDANGEVKYDTAHYVAEFKGQKSSPLIKYDSTSYALPWCTLTAQEVQAPDGYILNSKIYTIPVQCPKKSDGNYDKSKNLVVNAPVVKNDMDYGYIEIQKYRDADKKVPSPLSDKYNFAGAVYGVYKDSVDNKNLVARITTNANGYGKSDKIQKNGTAEYFVKEISAPTCGAYELDPTIYKVKLTSSTPVRVNSYDSPVPGSMELNKSLEGMENMSEEDIQELYDSKKLEGIHFELVHETLGYAYKKDLYTDKYGHASIDGLYFGKWTITEDPSTVPTGYKCIDPQEFEIGGHDNVNITMNIENGVHYRFLEIAKRDSVTGKEITLDSAVFKIQDEFDNDVELEVDGILQTEFSTIGGRVEYTNPLKGGKYTLIEVKAPNGYNLHDPIDFVIDEDGNAENALIIEVNDTPIQKSIQIKKVDRSTGKPGGAGFTFDVIAAKDIIDGNGSVRVVEGVKLTAGTVVDTITTDKSGVAKSKQLYLGSYYVQETGVNESGLAINHEKFPVELEDDGTDEQLMEMTVEIPNEPTRLELYKKDTLEDQPLAGVTFRVKEKDTKDSEEQLFVTDKDGRIRVPYLKKSTTYTIQEVKTLPGYNLDEEIVEFTVDDKGLINGSNIYQVTFTNQPNEVHISKRDITTGKELPGAEFVITDAEGKVFEEWTSTDQEHVIYKMPEGKYTLTEKTAPDGYEVEQSVEFEVKNSKVVQTVVMNDSPYREVELSKKDLTNNKELPGAHLQIKDADGKVIDEWVSTEEPHKIKLPAGKYVLVETAPATGYVTAERVEFEVVKTTAEDFSILYVEMKDDVTKVQISKKDITNEDELPGAKLQIKDANGKVVEEWISGKEPHYLERLPFGKYTLVEITAPEFYEQAKEVLFEVKDTGEIHEVVMYDSPYREIEISKKDLTNKEELPGAKLEIRNKDGKVIDKWVSKKKAHKVKLPTGKYILVETKPADGYITADSIKFEVVKRDKKDDVEIQQVEMFDDVTKVEISKQDVTNSKELPGAHLQIQDSKGKVVEEWVSTNTPHKIEKLPVGKYKLVETIAPDGYAIAESVDFEVGDTGEIQHVVMYDSPTPITPQTGDDFNLPLVVLIIVIAGTLIGGGIYFARSGKKKKESPKNTFEK